MILDDDHNFHLYPGQVVPVDYIRFRVVRSATKTNDESICFTTIDGEQFELRHKQYCCESVWIEDIVGCLSDLVGEPLLTAERVTDRDLAPPASSAGCDSYTWTFFKFATRKGYVDIRFFGTSNGCYSEDADMEYLGKV